MIHYSQCPICSSPKIALSLSAKDFTVTKENFPIWKCKDCSLQFTQDVPEQSAIGKYYQSEAYISHSDTKEGIINKLYHSVRKFTLSNKRKLIFSQTKKQKGNILDVGCGTGAFLNTMKETGWSITGLEPDEQAAQNAKSLYNIDTQSSDQLFNLPANSFDAITMWHVLEHVHQLQEYIAQLKKLLTKNGVLFIAVPNYTSHDAAHYKESWAAYDVPRHLYHFSPESMKVLIEKHGMNIKAIKPMWYDSFYVSMLSEKCKHDKNNIIKAFFIGFISNCIALFDKKKCSSVIYVIG